MNTGISWRVVTIGWPNRTSCHSNGPTGDLNPRTGNGPQEGLDAWYQIEIWLTTRRNESLTWKSYRFQAPTAFTGPKDSLAPTVQNVNWASQLFWAHEENTVPNNLKGTEAWPSCHNANLITRVLCRLFQEECARLREGVPYVKVYRYNPKHLCPKLNGYGDNGQRSLKLWQLLHTYWLPNTY